MSAAAITPAAENRPRTEGGMPRGLTSAEAAERLRALGPNEIATHRHRSVIRDFALLFLNPLIIILVVASVVSAILGEVVNSIIIDLMVVLSVVINFRQAYRSQRVVESLRQMVALTATALRDGKEVEIERRAVVPGDVLRLTAGDVVPADGQLLDANALFINEASLTGESIPVEKASSGDEAKVFLGSLVVSGSGTMVAVDTGPRTEFGKLAEGATTRAPETEFDRGIRRFAFLITRFVVVLVLFVLLVNLALKRDPIESFLFAVALAIGLTPELLPMIISVTLSSGAKRMADRQVVVKSLPAIQNLGSMDVFCSDKTGTLTVGAISLQGHFDAGGRDDDDALRLAAVNSAFETGLKSPLDQAILAAFQPELDRYVKIAELPFDFTRRRVSVIVDDQTTGERQLIAKGAPEGFFDICQTYRADGKSQPFDADARRRIDGVHQRLGDDGLRVLAVAARKIDIHASYDLDAESGLEFAGFVTFLDPAKPGSGDAIRALAADGIRVLIVTGDNDGVTAKVCRDIGIDPGAIILGKEIEQLNDLALGALAERTTVFARMTPEQKNRVIRVLKRRGHVVGFLGDGVNDAPSLHSADVGISVANASEVARESADVLLLRQDLQVLHDGVLEGRKSFGNVIKYILMGTSSSFGNMFSMAGAVVLLPFLPMLPIQILLNNLLYEIAQLTLPTDNVDDSFIRAPEHWDIRFIQRYMLVLGPVSSVFDFLTVWMLLHVFNAGEAEFHTGWFVESLLTQTLVIYVIRTAGNPLRSRPSRALVISTLAMIALGIAITFAPFRGRLGFTVLDWPVYLYVGVVAIVYLSVVDVVKRRLYR